MKKYYRLYIAHFTSETKGDLIYAGQRTSKCEDPKDDKYTGSGAIITKFKKKHGRGSIRMEWLPMEYDNQEDINIAELGLITKLKFMEDLVCVNIAEGGKVSNTFRYKTKEEMVILKEKMSNAKKDFFKTNPKKLETVAAHFQTTEAREHQSTVMVERVNSDSYKKRMKELWDTEEYKLKQSKAISEGLNKPESKKKLVRSLKLGSRIGEHWQEPLIGDLFKLWNELDQCAHYRLQKLSNERFGTDFKKYTLEALVTKCFKKGEYTADIGLNYL